MDSQQIIKNSGFGSRTIEGIWTGRDGKHFCNECRKLLLNGQVVIENQSPKPFRRVTQYNYKHKICPLFLNEIENDLELPQVLIDADLEPDKVDESINRMIKDVEEI